MLLWYFIDSNCSAFHQLFKIWHQKWQNVYKHCPIDFVWDRFQIICNYEIFSVFEIRFPSMESNIEARNQASNKTEPNYYHGSSNRYSTYSNSSNFAMRPNGSLPRKFSTNTGIPIRSNYYNYSHGEFWFLFFFASIVSIDSFFSFIISCIF